MTPAPTDQRRSLLLAASFFVVALAIASARVIASTKDLQHSTAPITEVDALRPFLSSLRGDSGGDKGSVVAAARDPFMSSETPATSSFGARRPVATDKRRDPWVVTTILLDGTRRSAIVNNTWVSVGDPLGDGSRLTAVERDHVVVTDANGIRHKVSIQGGES
jgi:hypothetical protein